MSDNKKIDEIRLSSNLNTDNHIKVSHIEHPYGEFSDSIVSIGLIKDGEFTNKLEVPYENIDELIQSLSKIKKIDIRLEKKHLHDELNADIGGG